MSALPAEADIGRQTIGGAAMLRILAATDLSANSDLALSRAICLAQGSGAFLKVVHVPETVLTDEARTGLRRRLTDQVKSEAGDDLESGIALLSGDPVEAILADAETFEPDLIVLGGHDRIRLRDALFGTTATRLLGRARVPVLVARSGGCFPYGRALVALDSSQSAEIVLRRSAAMAEVRHVFVIHASPAPGPAVGSVPWLDEADREERQTLSDIVARVAAALPSIHFHLDFNRGDTFRVLEDAVRHLEPNLLVLGMHPRRGLSSLLNESLAEESVAYFALDTLVVPLAQDRVVRPDLVSAGYPTKAG